MKIKRVKINNYRNLDGIELCFDKESNYIVGENNLGKSNFLSVLETVFSGRKFDDDDFGDLDKKIEVIMQLELKDEELGFFGDSFDPDDSSSITLRYMQSFEDAYPELVCENTGEPIPTKLIKKVHFMNYQSTSSPEKALKLTTKSGAGNVFGSIVEAFIQSEEGKNNFLDADNVVELTDYINERLSKLKGFSQYGIKAMVSSNSTELISNLFYLSDGKRRIEKTGCGVQFIAMVTLNILSQIMDIYKGKASKFSDQIYVDKDGKKILPVVIALDEPEVHLHPYLQRTLIAYYKSILSNDDSEFLTLIKSMFGLDGLDGQLFVVTHSSEILLDDYRNIIRFYLDGDNTNAISGMNYASTFDKAAEKQLIMRFKDIRETFFSHAVVIVEGETEYGAMPYFAEKLGIPLDEKCISIVMAKGESSINPLRKLFTSFKIPSVVIYDGDVKAKHKEQDENIYFTDGLCLETDIVDSLYDAGKQDVLKDISYEIDSQVKNVLLDQEYVAKKFKYIGRDITGYIPKKLGDIADTDKNEFCDLYKVWFLTHKGVITGRIFGTDTPAENIPKCYEEALLKASELA